MRISGRKKIPFDAVVELFCADVFLSKGSAEVAQRNVCGKVPRYLA